MKTVFSILLILIILTGCARERIGKIMTVKGFISSSDMGVSLNHEHLLVDFIGADSISNSRWDNLKVVKKVMPYLHQVKDLGCKTFVDCTPEYIGRDPLLLKLLSDSCGLNIVTNTGLYGAASDKFIPRYAYAETADQLANRWISEWKNGIGITGIKPGFIKIGVDNGLLSDIDEKLVLAAAKAHLQTGLTIASHTGSGPAFGELEILKKEGVSPEAFIWVHAQSEQDISKHIEAAKMGAWISLDGINEDNIDDYIRMIQNMKGHNLLGKVLLSHDAGWYDPSKENGGEFRGFTTLFKKLIPQLKKSGFSQKEIDQLLIINSTNAFTIRVRDLDNI